MAASKTLTTLGGRVQANTRAMVDLSAVERLRSVGIDVVFISSARMWFTPGLTTS